MEDLTGTFEVERSRPRRWVTIVALIVPVIAVVLSAAWFVRAFVAPPTVVIPTPMVLASAPSVADVAAADGQNAAVAEARARLADRLTETSGKSVYTPGLPMVASLAAAPPAPPPPVAEPIASTPPPPSSEPEPMVNPTALAAAPDTPTAPSALVVDPEPAALAEIGPGEPIQGPIPVPPRRPRVTVATVAHAVAGRVPLPRPRPVDATAKPEPDVQSFERHTVQ
jgi:hypothetical protein